QFKQQSRGVDRRTVLALTMQVLLKQLQFSRCAFFVFDKEKTSMQAWLALGEDVAALQQLQIEIATSRVFKGLLKKPQSLLVNAQNMQRYAPHLPEAFNAASADTFACMSLFAGQQPIGVVYVDRQSAKKFSAEHYACFKTLCTLANQSLRAVVTPAKTPAGPASLSLPG
ncbi:MAG: GAF domain-containing protein, partial [Gammaproteobacteria bacterium]|nr:GAF domain-containing protein [Gammaproteobacteria bacterium]